MSPVDKVVYGRKKSVVPNYNTLAIAMVMKNEKIIAKNRQNVLELNKLPKNGIHGNVFLNSSKKKCPKL